MKTTDRPVGLANLLAGLPAHTNFPTTNHKETTKVKTTPKAKPVAVVEVPVVEVKAVPADLLAIAVTEAIKSEDAVADAKVALRSACIAVFNANEAGVSFRALEQASKTAGKKISKSSFARYAKAGAILIKDESADALEVLAKINKAEKSEAKKADKPAKAEAETEGAEDSADDEVVAFTLAEIIANLTEDGAEAIAPVVANLVASGADDHKVFALLAVALLEASANVAPIADDETKTVLRVASVTVATQIGA